jgi:outer membrane lipoprotein
MILATGLALVGTTGCATFPVSKDLREQAQSTQEAGFAAIAQDPDAYRGCIVIWGGRIIETKNDTKSTSIYVLQSPLSRGGRPKSGLHSQGRFIARSAGFLEPEIYAGGTLVTVAGVLIGTETYPVHDQPYVYPVVEIKELRLWPRESDFYVYPAPYYSPWWYGPYCPYYEGSYRHYPSHYYLRRGP